MKVRAEVSAQKLRGGFYTPEPLVRFCLARLSSLLPPEGAVRFVEPSAGDGAFLRGIAADRRLAGRTAEVLAVEPFTIEAEKSRRAIAQAGMEGSVFVESAIKWGADAEEWFDAAVGNPPFVRYQFVSAWDKAQIARLGERLDLSFAGVSNLWLPVLAAALSRLRPGGAFSFVVPTELLTGLSASRLRQWVTRNFGDLRVDLFEPGSFPDVLQEVAVFSGRRSAEPAIALTVEQHRRDGGERSWTHELDPAELNWTRYLLEPDQLRALEAATAAPTVRPLGELARFQVSIVTGANDFFSVSERELEEFELGPWARPLLPRIRHAPGLIFSNEDQDLLREGEARCWLLDFSAAAADPRQRRRPAEYLRAGEERQLQERYKCRIREPWFRVPQIQKGALLLSKRSHRYPRVIVNEAGTYTTDTIYRGNPVPEQGMTPRALAAAFHSSLTLLTAELEGRSFGGGVLELVPSEIERLAVVKAEAAESWIEHLDALARSGEEEAVVSATDEALVASGALDAEVLAVLAEARATLLDHRLARNERVTASAPALEPLAA
jgi:adenine-specific DNA-methyltransferase